MSSVNFAQISSIPGNFIEEAGQRYREKGISYDRSLYEFAHQYKNLRLPKKLEQSFHELIQKVEEQLPAEQCRTNAINAELMKKIVQSIKGNNYIVDLAAGLGGFPMAIKGRFRKNKPKLRQKKNMTYLIRPNK